jgi:hypothetical protein
MIVLFLVSWGNFILISTGAWNNLRTYQQCIRVLFLGIFTRISCNFLPSFLPSFLPPPLPPPSFPLFFSPSLPPFLLSSSGIGVWIQSLMLARSSSTNWATLLTFFYFIFWIRSCVFAGIGLELQSSYTCLLHSWDYIPEPPCPTCFVEVRVLLTFCPG